MRWISVFMEQTKTTKTKNIRNTLFFFLFYFFLFHTAKKKWMKVISFCLLKPHTMYKYIDLIVLIENVLKCIDAN